ALGERRQHGTADALPLPSGIDGDVVELRDEPATRCGDRPTHHACTRRVAIDRRKPDEADFGPGKEEIERAGKRVRSSIAVRGSGCAVMRVATEELPEQSQ